MRLCRPHQTPKLLLRERIPHDLKKVEVDNFPFYDRNLQVGVERLIMLGLCDIIPLPGIHLQLHDPVIVLIHA